MEASFLAGVIYLDIVNLQGSTADIAVAVDLVKPAHLPLQIRERQYAGTAVYAGTFPARGTQ